MTQLLEDLKAVRELLTPPGRWTQGSSARDEDGIEVADNSPYAVKFCLYGAAERIVYGSAARWANILRSLKELESYPAHFNDTHSHSEVLALLDRVIEKEAAHV